MSHAHPNRRDHRVIDTPLFVRLGKQAGLEGDQLLRFGAAVEVVREHLTEDERDDFALDLMDAVRSGEDFNDAFHPWWLTAAIRQHPDYAWQKKEYENMKSSGDLLRSAQDVFT
jgi:exoribonuclease II